MGPLTYVSPYTLWFMHKNTIKNLILAGFGIYVFLAREVGSLWKLVRDSEIRPPRRNIEIIWSNYVTGGWCSYIAYCQNIRLFKRQQKTFTLTETINKQFTRFGVNKTSTIHKIKFIDNWSAVYLNLKSTQSGISLISVWKFVVLNQLS